MIEIFTTKFSTYLYIVCKNSWKFKVKIIFYYMFWITCPKHKFLWQHHTTTPQPFYCSFSGTTRVCQCQKRTSGLYDALQGKIKRGRQTDHPAGRHSIQTNQCPPPPSPQFFRGQMPSLPPNQQCQNTEGNSTEGSTDYTFTVISLMKQCDHSSIIVTFFLTKNFN